MYFYGQSSEYEEAVVIFTHLVEKRNVYLIVVDFFHIVLFNHIICVI